VRVIDEIVDREVRVRGCAAGVDGCEDAFLDLGGGGGGEEGFLEWTQLVVDTAVEGGIGEGGSAELEEEGEDEGLVEIYDYLEFFVSGCRLGFRI
jgi:hypothetical protein